MEKRFTKKIDGYITTFKDDIREKTIQLGLNTDKTVTQLLQFIYDYDKISISKEDFQKRKRVKNFVPICDRCIGKKSCGTQCTRKKKEGCDFCGTHEKGTPHGTVDSTSDQKNTTTKIEVWAQEIQGIYYYIDKNNNIYETEDILSGKINPKIIAKYEKQGEQYSVPEFGL